VSECLDGACRAAGPIARHRRRGQAHALAAGEPVGGQRGGAGHPAAHDPPAGAPGRAVRPRRPARGAGPRMGPHSQPRPVALGAGARPADRPVSAPALLVAATHHSLEPGIGGRRRGGGRPGRRLRRQAAGVDAADCWPRAGTGGCRRGDLGATFRVVEENRHARRRDLSGANARDAPVAFWNVGPDRPSDGGAFTGHATTPAAGQRRPDVRREGTARRPHGFRREAGAAPGPGRQDPGGPELHRRGDRQTHAQADPGRHGSSAAAHRLLHGGSFAGRVEARNRRPRQVSLPHHDGAGGPPVGLSGFRRHAPRLLAVLRGLLPGHDPQEREARRAPVLREPPAPTCRAGHGDAGEARRHAGRRGQGACLLQGQEGRLVGPRLVDQGKDGRPRRIPAQPRQGRGGDTLDPPQGLRILDAPATREARRPGPTLPGRGDPGERPRARQPREAGGRCLGQCGLPLRSGQEAHRPARGRRRGAVRVDRPERRICHGPASGGRVFHDLERAPQGPTHGRPHAASPARRFRAPERDLRAGQGGAVAGDPCRAARGRRDPAARQRWEAPKGPGGGPHGAVWPSGVVVGSPTA